MNVTFGKIPVAEFKKYGDGDAVIAEKSSILGLRTKKERFVFDESPRLEKEFLRDRALRAGNQELADSFGDMTADVFKVSGHFQMKRNKKVELTLPISGDQVLQVDKEEMPKLNISI